MRHYTTAVQQAMIVKNSRIAAPAVWEEGTGKGNLAWCRGGDAVK